MCSRNASGNLNGDCVAPLQHSALTLVPFIDNIGGLRIIGFVKVSAQPCNCKPCSCLALQRCSAPVNSFRLCGLTCTSLVGVTTILQVDTA